MKFYAKITSERAAKGQGGNQRLDIQITVGNAKNPISAGVIAVREIENGIFNLAYFHNGESRHIARIETKGEKRKGEITRDQARAIGADY